jgi:hypothetical protein
MIFRLRFNPSLLGYLFGIAAATAIVGTQGASAASRVVIDTFEQYSVGATVSNGNCKAVASSKDGVQGPYASSKRMAECNWDGIRKQAQWNDPLAELEMTYPFDFGTEYLVRMRYRIDADVDKKDGSKLGRLGDNPEAWTCAFGADQEHIWMSFWGPSVQVGSTYWGDNGPFCDRTQWHTIAFYVRIGNPGKITAWLDGGKISDFIGETAKSTNGSPLYVMSNWSVDGHPTWQHDANNHVYWDNIEIFSDLNTGTATTGSLADNSIISSADSGNPPPPPPPAATSTSPLAAPSNLRIINN